MKKVLEDLKTLSTLQNIILGYLILLGGVLLLAWIVPFKEAMFGVIMPIYFGLFLVIPFALFAMIFSLRVFKAMVFVEQELKSKASLAGWSSLVAGAYILLSFSVYSSVSELASTVDHNLVVVFQSSPVFMGLALLAIHVYVARSSLARLKAPVQ